MLLIKCCDISNEVRPIEVSEPWVDCLLEEYFMQVQYEYEFTTVKACVQIYRDAQAENNYCQAKVSSKIPVTDCTITFGWKSYSECTYLFVLCFISSSMKIGPSDTIRAQFYNASKAERFV